MSANWDVRQCIYCNLDPRATAVQKARRHSNLTSHMDNSHTNSEPIDGIVWDCPYCETIRHFVREDTLREHIRRMHRVDNPLVSLAAEQERIRNEKRDEERREEERREEERRVRENERRAYDQARQAGTNYHQRKIINRSKPRQDLQGLIPDTIEEENGDYEFKAKRLTKRSGKAKRSIKRSGKAKRSVKRSRKTKR